MSNTGIKKILFTVISVLIVATVVAVSFAVWDTKTADNTFKAKGGDRINVTVGGAENFNALLVPDGVIPSAASASTENALKNALYIYADFTPTMGSNDATKKAELRWKFKTLTIDNKDLLNEDKSLKDDAVLDCWVSTVATLDKPSDAIVPGSGKLVSGTKYYFVVKFRMFKYKEYTHVVNNGGATTTTNYTFYSNGTYKAAKFSDSAATIKDIDQALLAGLGVSYKSEFTLYQNAPYQSEHIDTAKYTGYSGKAIETEIEIYAEKSSK